MLQVGKHILIGGYPNKFAEHCKQFINELLLGPDPTGLCFLIVVMNDGFECLEVRMLINKQRVNGK